MSMLRKKILDVLFVVLLFGGTGVLAFLYLAA